MKELKEQLGTFIGSLDRKQLEEFITIKRGARGISKNDLLRMFSALFLINIGMENEIKEINEELSDLRRRYHCVVAELDENNIMFLNNFCD